MDFEAKTGIHFRYRREGDLVPAGRNQSFVSLTDATHLVQECGNVVNRHASFVGFLANGGDADVFTAIGRHLGQHREQFGGGQEVVVRTITTLELDSALIQDRLKSIDIFKPG